MSIELEVAGGVAEIVLNVPDKLNALDSDHLAMLSDAYIDAEKHGVRALLLRGEGRAFCAGRDISGVDPETDDVLGYLGGIATPLFRRIAEFPAPTFAIAHGACLGIGLGLLVASDIVYVAENARIGSPFAKLGATLDSGGHALFVERFGTHRTMDLIVTGELITGQEAVERGLFSRALPADEVLEFTREKVAAAAAGATESFIASKQIVAKLRDERIGLWDSIAQENQAQSDLSETEDYREGFLSFQEKRTPVFRGAAR